MVSEISANEYTPYYATYISKTTLKNIPEGLRVSKEELITFIQEIPAEKLTYAYAHGKWTIAEVLVHILDTERILGYRALRFARNDKSPLVGFDQDAYIPNSNANMYTKEELIADFSAVRNHSISLFNRFTDEMKSRIGEANESQMSTRAAGYVIIGHQKHHVEVIKERYL